MNILLIFETCSSKRRFKTVNPTKRLFERNVFLIFYAVDKQMFEVYIVTEYASGGDLFNVLRFV